MHAPRTFNLAILVVVALPMGAYGQSEYSWPPQQHSVFHEVDASVLPMNGDPYPPSEALDQEMPGLVAPAPAPAPSLFTGWPSGPAFPDGSRFAVRSLLDSLELFTGLEGSKQPQDFGVNAHFGARLHVNWGVPLVEQWGLGAQIGTAVNLTDHAVRVTSQIDGAGSRTQSFTTIGLFQRAPNGWTWALAHDFLAQEDYDTFFLSQWRGRVGYAVSERDEVGVFGMLPQADDGGSWAGIPVRLTPLAQGSVYWRHTWENCAEITGWFGIAEDHNEVNVALGDNGPAGERIVFGSDVHIPLGDSWALFGEANFITPADSGTVDAYLGLAYYPGRTAHGWRKRRFSPVLPVANNTSFSVDLSR